MNVAIITKDKKEFLLYQNADVVVSYDERTGTDTLSVISASSLKRVDKLPCEVGKAIVRNVLVQAKKGDGLVVIDLHRAMKEYNEGKGGEDGE